MDESERRETSPGKKVISSGNPEEETPLDKSNP